MSEATELVVSTDGSALNNPNGPMGWAWADHEGGDADAGGASNGTNQIGELCAILQALRAHRGSQPLTIESDSQYAINCSTTWVRNWEKKGWKNSQGKPVKNCQLIKAISQEISQREGPVHFVWIKGHDGNHFNEKVDTLARSYAADTRDGIRQGFLPIEGWQSLLDSDYAQGLDLPDPVRAELKGGPSVLDEQGRQPDKNNQPDKGQAGLEGNNVHLPDASHPDHTTDTPESDAGEEKNDTSTRQEESTDQVKTPAPSQAGEDKRVAEQTAEAPTNPSASTSKNSSASGLLASGSIQITPPPSASPRFVGQTLHISGRIELDADIDQDGKVIIDQAPFRLRSIKTRG